MFKFIFVFIGAFLFLFVFTACLVSVWVKDYDRLMDQCMSDGHKEYECVSMLRSERSTYVAPMPIVISR